MDATSVLTYDEYEWLWPPRPTNPIPYSLLKVYERRGWVCQVKKNGTLTETSTNGNRVVFMNRHNETHGLWKPLNEHKQFFKQFGPKWFVFEAELLHEKTTTIKNHLYIFDILVADGVHLTGKTFDERQELLLETIFGTLNPKTKGDCFPVDKYVSVARTFRGNFARVWANLSPIPDDGSLPVDEGLVLKDPDAPLKLCYRKKSNSDWQVKCRRPNKNLGF